VSRRAGSRRTGLDDAEHRHRRELGREFLERHRRRRVARHDEALHAAVAQQPRRLQRVAADRFGTLGAVRQPRRVAEIEEILAGQCPRERAQHREAADTRIEDAHGSERACIASGTGWHWSDLRRYGAHKDIAAHAT
jgi:hypothetical protein